MATGIDAVKNQRGSSLLAVMISAAIGLVVVLAVSQIIVKVVSTYKVIQENNEIESTVSTIYHVLLSPAACRKTFFESSGAPITRPIPTQSMPMQIDEVRAENGNPLFSVAPSKQTFWISRMLVRPPQNQDALSRATDRLARGEMIIEFQRSAGTATTATLQRSLPLCFNYDGASTLTGCGCSADSGPDQVEWVFSQLGQCPNGQYFRGVSSTGALDCSVPATPPVIYTEPQ